MATGTPDRLTVGGTSSERRLPGPIPLSSRNVLPINALG